MSAPFFNRQLIWNDLSILADGNSDFSSVLFAAMRQDGSRYRGEHYRRLISLIFEGLEPALRWAHLHDHCSSRSYLGLGSRVSGMKALSHSSPRGFS